MKEEQEKPQKVLGFLIFLFGLILAAAIALTAIWGDLEAALFDVAIKPQETLNTLHCPALITDKETAEIFATFDNKVDKTVEITVRAHISQGFVTYMREEDVRLSIPAQSKETLSWQIAPEDAAFNRVVLARITSLRKPGYPSKGNGCGIMVLHTNLFTGRQIIIGTLLVSLAMLAGGAYLWGFKRRSMTPHDREVMQMMSLFTIAVLFALIMGLIGLWGFGVFAFVIILLMLGISFEHFARQS